MPELPEVETIVRGLTGQLEGHCVTRVRVFRPDLIRLTPRTFGARLRGRCFTGVGRRAKNIVMELDDESRLVVNLGMTGRLLLQPASASRRPPTAYAGVALLTGDAELVYDDVRRFGVVEVLSANEWTGRSLAFGPEPLASTFTSSVLHARLQTSRSPVRSWLLDQRRIAGVGNIYANEALYRARIHPTRAANSLTRGEAAALHRHLRTVLRRAIRARGTTLRDYRDAQGEQGSFGPLLEVYGRDGQPCGRCSGLVQRIVFGGRSAFVCPACQPRRRRRAHKRP